MSQHTFLSGLLTNVSTDRLNSFVSASRHCIHGVNNVNDTATIFGGGVSLHFFRCAAPPLAVVEIGLEQAWVPASS